MALTRAAVETILVQRTGRRLDFVGLPGTGHTAGTDTPPRSYLSDALASAVRSLGLTLADPTTVVDGDLISVTTGDQVDQLLDVAELRILETILGNWDKFDQTKGMDGQYLGRMADSLQKAIDALRKRIQVKYGIGLGTLRGGGISFLRVEGTTDFV
jgi:hypothetical protein